MFQNRNLGGNWNIPFIPQCSYFSRPIYHLSQYFLKFHLRNIGGPSFLTSIASLICLLPFPMYLPTLPATAPAHADGECPSRSRCWVSQLLKWERRSRDPSLLKDGVRFSSGSGGREYRLKKCKNGRRRFYWWNQSTFGRRKMSIPGERHWGPCHSICGPLASGKSLEDFVRKAESEAPPQTCTQNHNLHFNLRSYFFIPHLRLCLLILERGRKGEREREKNICMQNINWLPPYIPWPGIEPAT